MSAMGITRAELVVANVSAGQRLRIVTEAERRIASAIIAEAFVMACSEKIETAYVLAISADALRGALEIVEQRLARMRSP